MGLPQTSTAVRPFQLDGLHRQNMRLMLRSVNLRPFLPFSPPAFGVDPGAQVALDYQGLLEEAAGFEIDAYGALIGLVYWRALQDGVRNAWDQRIQQILRETDGAIYQIKQQGNSDWIANAGGGNLLDLQKASARRGAQKQAVVRRADYFNTLRMCKDSLFPGNTAADINNNDILVLHPWCLSDSEFTYVMSAIQMKNFDPDSFNVSLQTPTAIQNIVKMSKDQAIKFAKSKMEEALKSFLKWGANKLPDFVGKEGVQGFVIGKLVDLLMKKLDEQRKQSVKNAYFKDEERRLFLASVGWGSYTKPVAPTAPSAADYSRQSLPGR